MNKSKVCVYSKWLTSLGGGEKVATVMAETLSKNYSVDLVSTFAVDKKSVEKKMGVDLKRVNLVSWNERAYELLKKRTTKYDIFINTSYLDHLPSEARKSIYYLHFPSPIKGTILGFIKYEKVLPFLRKYLIIPSIDRGLERIDNIHSRGGSWLGKSNTLVVSNISSDSELTIRIYNERLDLSDDDRIKISSPNSHLKIIDKIIDHKSNVIVYRINYKLKKHKESLVLKIDVSGDNLLNPVAIVSLTIKNIRYFAWNFIKKYLPDYEMALYGSSSYKPAEGLETYDIFLSNSRFTQAWTRRYWKKDSKVLYPPVDVQEFKPGKKTKTIINVGRFFVGGHSKNQHILVEAFKQMVDGGLLDKDWSLHLVGGVSDGWEHAEYLRNIEKSIGDYKIFIHNSISFTDLKKLYARASIYWHATGYGISEHLNPIQLEHFGIAPVEGMAAGCVPIVYRGGGLVETVSGDVGFTWKTIDELVEYTKKVINNSSLRKQLSDAAMKRSRRYSREEFSRKLLDIVEKL